ncbi:hypothetical protein KTO58_19830 [Chitinophaga pendula]|uniref:hypothetical protein n=1 Tax=Chitinophaga TaxID=79328 RepID=UPI000BAF061C|nr:MULTISPECIES: hypothetical protein [Chitinophaga]ASZ11082.1 hypothetical protein CK934_08970 [Chitinophaga sp. MD30]UCJ05921.1 hypothetical protein KTO58_19830 [Chitinophaga pendula]
MKELLKGIQNRILSEIPAFKYVDEDWGQIDYYSTNPPVNFPFVLIDITEVQWSGEGNGAQLGIATVLLRIGNMKLGNTSGGAPANQKEKAFEIFDHTESIHKNLHGWSAGDQLGPLTRLTTRRVRRDDSIQEYQITFSVQIKDTTGHKKAQSVRLGTVAITPL